MQTEPASTPKPFTGRHMAIIMVSFFAVVIAVNMVLVVVANRSWTGLVVKNSYVASQSFDKDTAKLKAIEAMGIHARLVFEAGRISVSLMDDAGTPLMAEGVSLKIGRAAYESDDQTITLTNAGAGIYQAEAKLDPGPWVGSITADVAGKGHWTKLVRLHVKD